MFYCLFFIFVKVRFFTLLGGHTKSKNEKKYKMRGEVLPGYFLGVAGLARSLEVLVDNDEPFEYNDEDLIEIYQDLKAGAKNDPTHPLYHNSAMLALAHNVAKDRDSVLVRRPPTKVPDESYHVKVTVVEFLVEVAHYLSIKNLPFDVLHRPEREVEEEEEAEEEESNVPILNMCVLLDPIFKTDDFSPEIYESVFKHNLKGVKFTTGPMYLDVDLLTKKARYVTISAIYPLGARYVNDKTTFTFPLFESYTKKKVRKVEDVGEIHLAKADAAPSPSLPANARSSSPSPPAKSTVSTWNTAPATSTWNTPPGTFRGRSPSPPTRPAVLQPGRPAVVSPPGRGRSQSPPTRPAAVLQPGRPAAVSPPGRGRSPSPTARPAAVLQPSGEFGWNAVGAAVSSGWASPVQKKEPRSKKSVPAKNPWLARNGQ
jgi:hypothetical protein